MIQVKTGDTVILSKDSLVEYVVTDAPKGPAAFSIKVEGLPVWIDLDIFERAGGYVSRTVDDFPIGTKIQAKFVGQTVKVMKVEEYVDNDRAVWRGYDRDDKSWANWYALEDLEKIEVIG